MADATRRAPGWPSSSSPPHCSSPCCSSVSGRRPGGTEADGPAPARVGTRSVDRRAGDQRRLATPGEVGPAVILGHVDTARDGPAVFYRLHQLRPGDTVTVHRIE